MELCRDADVVITEYYKPIDRDVMSAMTRCRAIIRSGIGFDTIDMEAARDLGIDVVNIPAYAPDEVSDHALALLLELLQTVGQEAARVLRGERPLSVANAEPQKSPRNTARA